MQVDWKQPRRYKIVDTETGEEENLSLHMSAPAPKGWNLTYPHELARMLTVVGGPASKLMAYMLTNHTADNTVKGSVASLAEQAGVSKATAARTMKNMQKAGLLKKEQNGLYMMNPRLLSWAGTAFQRLSSIWEKLS